MKVGDLVRCLQQYHERPRVGVFLGYESSKHHSYVWVEGEKLLFLTRELEEVR